MLSIHRIAKLEAKISDQPESHWLTLVITEPDGETKIEVTMYFSTRQRGFAEEHRFATELAAAINGLHPMDIGQWPPAEEVA